jgi:hypothetical protein
VRAGVTPGRPRPGAPPGVTLWRTLHDPRPPLNTRCSGSYAGCPRSVHLTHPDVSAQVRWQVPAGRGVMLPTGPASQGAPVSRARQQPRQSRPVSAPRGRDRPRRPANNKLESANPPRVADAANASGVSGKGGPACQHGSRGRPISGWGRQPSSSTTPRHRGRRGGYRSRSPPTPKSPCWRCTARRVGGPGTTSGGCPARPPRPTNTYAAGQASAPGAAPTTSASTSLPSAGHDRTPASGGRDASRAGRARCPA